MEIPMIETKLCWTFWKHLFSSRFGKSWCIQVYNRSANAFQECLYPSSGHYIAPGTSFVRNWICAEKKWREPDQEYLWAFFIAKFPKSMRKNVQHVMNNQTSLYFLGLHWCHYWNSVTHKGPWSFEHVQVFNKFSIATQPCVTVSPPCVELHVYFDRSQFSTSKACWQWSCSPFARAPTYVRWRRACSIKTRRDSWESFGSSPESVRVACTRSLCQTAFVSRAVCRSPALLSVSCANNWNLQFWWKLSRNHQNGLRFHLFAMNRNLHIIHNQLV